MLCTATSNISSSGKNINSAAYLSVSYDYVQKKKNTESTERRKTGFPKETLGNTDLHKTVLNKTMTLQEKCVKYDFVAPLTIK